MADKLQALAKKDPKAKPDPQPGEAPKRRKSLVELLDELL